MDDHQELEALALEALKADNDRRLADLAQRGLAVGNLEAIRVSCFLEVLLEDSGLLAKAVTAFHERVHDLLDAQQPAALQQLAQAEAEAALGGQVLPGFPGHPGAQPGPQPNRQMRRHPPEPRWRL